MALTQLSPNIQVKLSLALKYSRLAKRLSRRKLAEKTGLTDITIYYMERHDRSNPVFATMLSLQKVLQFDMNKLVDRAYLLELIESVDAKGLKTRFDKKAEIAKVEDAFASDVKGADV